MKRTKIFRCVLGERVKNEKQEVPEMEWLEKMNDALRYIEENLENGIDYRMAAQIACSSLTRFQKMFTFVTDITIGDYVRYRKMTLAAQELKETDIKVIDLAAKYGYDSPDAFTRAFRAFHGISPSDARNNGKTREYPPISFQISVQEGDTMLGGKTLIRMEQLHCRAVEFRVNCMEPEKHAWNLMREWVLKNLRDYEVRRYIGYAPCGHHPEGEGENVHEYCALFLLHDDEGKDGEYFGAKVVDAPRGVFLVGDVVLNEYFEDCTIDIGLSMKNASQTIYECMKNMGGYELDFDGRTYLEEHFFKKEWFTADCHEAILPEYRFWLPIKKQSV